MMGERDLYKSEKQRIHEGDLPQMMGERDKERNPITAGLYMNWSVGKSHMTSGHVTYSRNNTK